MDHIEWIFVKLQTTFVTCTLICDYYSSVQKTTLFIKDGKSLLDMELLFCTDGLGETCT